MSTPLLPPSTGDVRAAYYLSLWTARRSMEELGCMWAWGILILCHWDLTAFVMSHSSVMHWLWDDALNTPFFKCNEHFLIVQPSNHIFGISTDTVTKGICRRKLHCKNPLPHKIEVSNIVAWVLVTSMVGKGKPCDFIILMKLYFACDILLWSCVFWSNVD